MMRTVVHMVLLVTLFTGTNLKAQEKSIQLSLGTQGVGAEFNYLMSPAVALRAGANVVPLKANNVFEISDFNSSSRVSADFYNFHLLADYKPFSQVSWFHFTGGLAYFLKARSNVRITPSDNYTYGDLVLSDEQVGYVDLNVDWKGLAPYLGVSFGRNIPGKSFNVKLDLGTYRLKRPEAAVTGAGLLEGNSGQTGQFQSNIRNYRWLPVLQVNFNFKLKQR